MTGLVVGVFLGLISTAHTLMKGDEAEGDDDTGTTTTTATGGDNNFCDVPQVRGLRTPTRRCRRPTRRRQLGGGGGGDGEDGDEDGEGWGGGQNIESFLAQINMQNAGLTTRPGSRCSASWGARSSRRSKRRRARRRRRTARGRRAAYSPMDASTLAALREVGMDVAGAGPSATGRGGEKEEGGGGGGGREGGGGAGGSPGVTSPKSITSVTSSRTASEKATRGRGRGRGRGARSHR